MGLVTIVVAGNRKQFDDYVRQFPEELRREFVYASDDQVIRGIEAKAIIKVGTWYERDDAHDILDYARTRIRNKRK